MKWKEIGKSKLIKVDGKIYEYQIMKWEDGRKTIRYKGIVTYSEAKKINEILRKKYQWLSTMK